MLFLMKFIFGGTSHDKQQIKTNEYLLLYGA